ncbi:hypothetical protein [Sneathiella chinensis]|uniref:Secreted protein n=1 Tax=Sneathiella chinensis TaxID=349750 RepID=A0ABQ5U2F4_9PROT|nr:hypothetical protein [Sneathiella chinensis]GLQ06292.1 hypothetical protein GCM10007924_15130 [Sneathiella chinensis]
MNTFSKLLAGLGVAVGLSLISSTAFSATCSFGDTLFDGTSGADLTTSTACEYYEGNDTNQIGLTIDPFGITDWTLAAKSDGPDGDGALTLSGVVDGDTSGSWDVGDFMGYTTVMISMKAGDAFAAYLLDTSFTSGLWTTESVFPNRDGGRELSHISLYYSPQLTQIPLPAALPLYLAGMLLLGAFGWLKASKTTG